MALVLREDDVRQLLDMDAVITAVEDATRELGEGKAQNQPRRRVRPPGAVLNVMSASYPGRSLYGLKSYSVAGGRARFLVTVFAAGGTLEALIEADHLGASRTGAATAVAVRALAPRQPHRVALIGAGHQAWAQALALGRAIDMTELHVYSRHEERRREFCRRLREQAGLPALAAESAEAAVRGSQVVVAMTTSSHPVLDSDWVADGAVVVGAGSNLPHHAELPPDLFRDAAVVVDQLETARLESGDLIRAAEAGTFAWDDALELGAVLTGMRVATGRCTVFESHGLAVWDLAAAATVIAAAHERRVGEDLALLA